MGNCGSKYDLRQCVHAIDEPLDANPDIIGLGVLAGFTATAVFTFAAIIVGYFTKSLPEGCLTEFDHKVVEEVASSWVGRISARAWEATIRISRRCLFLEPPNKNDELDEEQRREALKKFVLTLSDQQLVTGIAILVACFGNWCRTSAYELNMVVSLAWFSSATHLATLDVLQDYFQRNRVVRNWRMIGMIANVLLLIVGLILTGFYSFATEVLLVPPLPCLKYLSAVDLVECNGTTYYIDSTDCLSYGDNCHTMGHSDNTTVQIFSDSGSLYYNGSHYNKCTVQYESWDDDDNILYLGSIFTIMYLVYAYTSALVHTFTISEKTTLTLTHILVYLIHNFLLEKIPMEVVNNALVTTRAMARSKNQGTLAKLFKIRQMSSTRIQKLRLRLEVYTGSFLFNVGGLFFALSYGLSQVATYRWDISRPELQAGSNSIDFGQIVPLVLLTLPLLAAAEVFHENDDREVKEVSIKDPISTPAEIAASAPDDDNDIHSTASSEKEQVRAPRPGPSGPEAIASTSRIPSQLADSHTLSHESPQSSRIQLIWLVGLVFFWHVSASIAAGIVLNLTGFTAIAGPVIMVPVLGAAYAIYLKQISDAVRLLRAAARNNTLYRYRNDARASDEGNIEAPTIGEKPEFQSTGAAQPWSLNHEASHDLAAVTESSVAGAAMERSPRTSGQTQRHNATASQTALQGQEEYEDPMNEAPLYSGPSRQDTESGLREQR